MQLEHSFSVPVGVEEAWAILCDIDRIGPCLPGTKIESVDGDEITGAVKVKLGPLNLNYQGKAVFVEKDAAAHRAVVDASGSDARGHGTASATVTATLVPAGAATTTVQVHTELELTGKPAQFGHGVMVDVGNKLLGQFAAALTETLPAAEPDPSDAPVAAAVEEPAGLVEAELDGGGAEVDELADDIDLEAVAELDEVDQIATGSLTGALSTDGRAADELLVDDLALAPADERGPAGLELLHFARPAVAKRIAPVAVALVIVLIAARRRAASRAR